MPAVVAKTGKFQQHFLHVRAVYCWAQRKNVEKFI